MSSQAQVLANRRNAGRSTGPRTPEGKAVVAQNAVKHGLLARQAVIRDEDPAEFEMYRRHMLDRLAPDGPVEEMLAQRVVSLSWRLKRAERMQDEAFDYLMEAGGGDGWVKCRRSNGDPSARVELTFGRAAARDFAEGKTLDRLMMYERRIENSLYRTMNELHKLKRLPEEDGHAKQRQPTTAGGSVKTEGLGDGLVATEADHRQAALDAATRSAPPETANDSAKQSQFPPEEEPRGQRVAHPTAAEPLIADPTQQANSLSCETKPIAPVELARSVPVRASEGTPDGVTTSGTDRAKQSQLTVPTRL